MNKVEKIRREIEKRYEYWKEKESNSHSIESESRMSECQHLLLLFNSLQEEPVSNDLEEAAHSYVDTAIEWFDSEGNPCCYPAFIAGAQWQKERDQSTIELAEEPVSEDLEKAALLYYPKMSRISEPHGIIPADNESHYLGDANEDNRKAFKAGAQWGKEQTEIQIKAQSIALPHGCPKKEPVSKDLEYFAKKESESFAEREYEIDYIDRNALTKGYYWGAKAGAQWQKEQMIDKAVKWLYEHREEVQTEDNGISGWISDELIMGFKKTMKE